MSASVPHHFQVTDPRGRQVVCSDDTWFGHICQNHFDMEGREAQVKTTIRRPHGGAIYRDVDEPNRDVYYHLPSGKKYYVKVVVEFDNLNKGRVITAYRASARKPGERKIWPK